MRPVWIFAAVVPFIAGHALAQALIPPSRTYSNQQAPDAYQSPTPTPLDKDFGLPKAAPREPEATQQKIPTKLRDQPDPFAGLSTFGRPDEQPSETPDFFKASPGVAAPNTQTSDVPNFFETTPDATLPKASRPQSAYSTTDTPMFTTTDDGSPDNSAADRAALSYAPTEDTTSGDTTTPSKPGTR